MTSLPGVRGRCGWRLASWAAHHLPLLQQIFLPTTSEAKVRARPPDPSAGRSAVGSLAWRQTWRGARQRGTGDRRAREEAARLEERAPGGQGAGRGLRDALAAASVLPPDVGPLEALRTEADALVDRREAEGDVERLRADQEFGWHWTERARVAVGRPRLAPGRAELAAAGEAGLTRQLTRPPGSTGQGDNKSSTVGHT